MNSHPEELFLKFEIQVYKEDKGEDREIIMSNHNDKNSDEIIRALQSKPGFYIGQEMTILGINYRIFDMHLRRPTKDGDIYAVCCEIFVKTI